MSGGENNRHCWFVARSGGGFFAEALGAPPPPGSKVDWRRAVFPPWMYPTNYSAAVVALLTHVDVLWRDRCGRILRGEDTTFAQAWQDWILWHNVYKHRPELLEYGRGFYLDIGANHPTVASNTLFFDKCLGWAGVCFEPNKRWHGMLSRHRSCKLVKACVLGSASRVAFEGAGPKRATRVDNSSGTKCVVASAALAELGLAGRRIDLLSVDIEGAEASVLRCWPFEQLPIHAILLETNHPLNAAEVPASEETRTQVSKQVLSPTRVLCPQPRAVDRFFHRNGYANVESFATALRGKPAQHTDNLYVRREPAPVYPNLRANSYEERHHRNCPPELMHMGWWCTEYLAWEPSSNRWGRCVHENVDDTVGH